MQLLWLLQVHRVKSVLHELGWRKLTDYSLYQMIEVYRIKTFSVGDFTISWGRYLYGLVQIFECAWSQALNLEYLKFKKENTCFKSVYSMKGIRFIELEEICIRTISIS